MCVFFLLLAMNKYERELWEGVFLWIIDSLINQINQINPINHQKTTKSSANIDLCDLNLNLNLNKKKHNNNLSQVV